jgi:hypothetical protein
MIIILLALIRARRVARMILFLLIRSRTSATLDKQRKPTTQNRQEKFPFAVRAAALLILAIPASLAIHLLVDPLIPGLARIHVHAPRASNSSIVEIEPVPCNTLTAPAKRTKHGGLDSTGTAIFLINFRLLETYVHVQLYKPAKFDDTPSDFDVKEKVHWYNRVGLRDKHIWLTNEIK